MSRSPPVATADAPLRRWFRAQGWQVAPFQREVWQRFLAGESGLLHTPTGSGKTLAAAGGPLLAGLADQRAGAAAGSKRRTPVLRLLWVTPLKALASDTQRALQTACAGIGLSWQVGLRTGDASARDKRLARTGRLDALVITPESLALLLSHADTAEHFAQLQAVVVDEWHELLGSKRGVLLQLALARLRQWRPDLRIWGLSATLGNLPQARDVLLPHLPQAALVGGVPPKPLHLTTLLPQQHERFPWAGHIGLAQLPRVLQQLMRAPTSLLFANTRAHAELWHRALASVWPEDLATLALHHGSLDPALRQQVEQGLREGRLRCVVATSSLDLGVDFPAVDQVLQLGSPKGVARLLQRAGRARHRPGTPSAITGVPVQALEMLEYAAARQAVEAGEIEPREPPRLCLDVLAQHCVTLALGGGFEAEALYREVRGTYAYAELTRADWQAVLDFIAQGGKALANYPDYHRVTRDADGRWVVRDKRAALRQRLSIGTIGGEGMVSVRWLRGGSLGAIEEGFASRLRPGERFHFAGRLLQLVRLEDMTAYVRKATGGEGSVPQWSGTRLPLSGTLARRVERLFTAAPETAPELPALQPLLALQRTLSALPQPGHLLVEHLQVRGTSYLALYPFAGLQLHEGLATLLALRWSRLAPCTLTFSVGEHGLLLGATQQTPVDAAFVAQLLRTEGFMDDLHAGFNLAELARRQFREVARIAGLLPPSVPGRLQRSLRQLQASSGLLFDVLRRHDPEHILLAQAEREALQYQLNAEGLATLLADCSARQLVLTQPASFTPLAFPLWAETVRGRLSSEDWRTRIQRAAARLERRHGG